MCWFYGVSVFPLSDYYALQFTLPLFTIAGAVMLLDERTAPHHGNSHYGTCRHAAKHAALVGR